MLKPKATLFASLDKLAGVPAEILMRLKFAREQNLHPTPRHPLPEEEQDFALLQSQGR